jgi:hypothetical protein
MANGIQGDAIPSKGISKGVYDPFLVKDGVNALPTRKRGPARSAMGAKGRAFYSQRFIQLLQAMV